MQISVKQCKRFALAPFLLAREKTVYLNFNSKMPRQVSQREAGTIPWLLKICIFINNAPLRFKATTVDEPTTRETRLLLRFSQYHAETLRQSKWHLQNTAERKTDQIKVSADTFRLFHPFRLQDTGKWSILLDTQDVCLRTYFFLTSSLIMRC